MIEIKETAYTSRKVKLLKEEMAEYFAKNLQGNQYINKDLHIPILVNRSSLKHILNRGVVGFGKVALIKVLPELIAKSTFVTKGAPKDIQRDVNVSAYLNFRIDVRIFGVVREVNIVVRVYGKGKNEVENVYYHHSIKSLEQ